MPKISVIVPAYNVQDYLVPCVDSILDQSFRDFELIIVDDGSTDRTAEICDRYAMMDSRVIVKHKTNGGVSSARNFGLLLAQAEWVTFIDADDWVEKTYLENFQMDDDTADLYIQGLQFVNSITKKVTEEKELPSLRIDKTEFSTQVPKYNILALGFPVCKRYKKSIIDANNIKFNEKISHHEDHIFVFEYMMYVKSIVLSTGLIYNYRYFHNPNSLSSKHEDVESMKEASNLMLSYFTRLLQLYKIKDISYEKKVGTLCIMPIVSAIIHTYRQKSKERYHILKQNFPDSKTICRFYYPIDNLGRCIKFLGEMNWLYLIHLFLLLYYTVKR